MGRIRDQTPLARRIDGVNVIDLLCDFDSPGLPFHRVMLLSVIATSVKERAKELLFDPWLYEDADEHGYKAGLRMGYLVDEERQEFVPPPRWLRKTVLREIEAIADIWSVRRRAAHALRRLAYLVDRQNPPPRQGLIRLSVGDRLLDVDVTAWPTRLGHQIYLNLPPITDEIVASIESAHLRHFEEIEGRPDPDDQ
jgi:hypothetical protein